MSKKYFRSVGQQAASLGKKCPRYWDKPGIPIWADCEARMAWYRQKTPRKVESR